jgi:hypothetical protein
MVACGRLALFNAYLPGNKHKARLDIAIEKVFAEISPQPLPEGR